MCIQTCYLLSNKPAYYHSASKTNVRDGIFKLSPIHASVICQILWIRWIQWIPVTFRKNSTGIFSSCKQQMSVKALNRSKDNS